jgi:hypothetical protein
MNAIDRKWFRELKYEIDQFIWELVVCKEGSTKMKIIQENDENKD